MPWDSLRKRLSTDSSSGSKIREQQHRQQDQPVRSPKGDRLVFANVVNQVVGNRTQDPRPSSSWQSPVGQSTSAKGCLSPELFQKIKEVDQETSTLTVSGVKGLSARIIDKHEYSQPAPDGTLQTGCSQTVEIIKRPGQSLGLYLREGNEEDRYDGVFVSRLQEGSDLHKSGVLRVGDEILSVNKVNVTKRNIDEVVVMISIPRRLLLQTRTELRKPGYSTAVNKVSEDFDGGKFIKPIDSRANFVSNKPIAVIKQLPRDESRESTTTDDGAPLASSQLMATAHTSLGAKARAQEATAAYSAKAYASASTRQPVAPQRVSSSVGHQSRSRERNPLAQRSLSERWAQNRQYFADQNPRLVDVEVHAFPGASADDLGAQNRLFQSGHVWQRGYVDEPMSSNTAAGFQSTLANTAYLHPPKLQGHLPTMERAAQPTRINPHAASECPVESDQFQMASPVPSSWSQPPAPVEYVTATLFSPSSVASDSRLTAPLHPQPRSALRQPSAFPTSVFPSIKSNSLPRRNVTGRTIKWRNDVLFDAPESNIPNVAMNPRAEFNPSAWETTDSDGAVSAPETALSPGSANVPNPVYLLPRTPTSGKTIDDVFSRAEYRAWERIPRRVGPEGPHNIGAYPNQRVYARSYAQRQPGPSSNYGEGVAPIEASAQDRPSEHWFLQSGHEGTSYGLGPIPSNSIGRVSKTRSSSLPPRGMMDHPHGTLAGYGRRADSDLYGYDARTLKGDNGEYVLDFSPLPRRRLPLSLAAANPSFGYTAAAPLSLDSNTSTGSSACLTGILLLRIIEGRQIRSREPEEIYCVVEVDGEHRARTEVSDWQSAFHWNEMFEIDVWDCRRADFYIYSWHPQYRHRLRHRGFLQLVDTLEESKLGYEDEWMLYQGTQTGHSFALNLDPRGQLFIQAGFQSMPVAYRRHLAIRRSAYWGVPLQALVERETGAGAGGGHVPTVLRRLVQEIERRGVDSTGLYILCGSSSKKHLLKDQLEREPDLADLSPDSVPDLNILTSVLKDFLRELPEPVVPNCMFQMLLDAWKVCAPNDKEGNAKLVLRVIDCLPRTNKCTFMVLMDHLKYVISQSPHNGLSCKKCGVVFGPLLFCTSQAYPLTSIVNIDTRSCPPKQYFSFLDHRLAARLLEVLLELWPSPRSSSESSGSENSTINLTSHGNTSLVDLWLQENRLPESNC